MTMVKELARPFYSPGGATVGYSSYENVNRVRFAPKQSTIDRSARMENRVSMHQDNNVDVVVANMHHRHASSNAKDDSVAARQAHRQVKGLPWRINDGEVTRRTR